MKNLVKKAVLLLLAAVLAVGVVGCKPADSGGEKEDSGLSATEILSSMPEELKGTTIKFLNWYDPYKREDGPVIEAFEQATGCKVEVLVREYGEAYNTALASMVATGEAPDVFRMRQPEPTLLKLCHNIDVMDFDFEASSIWDKPTMETYSVGGISYAVNLTKTPFFLPKVYYYRTDIIEEMGYEDPYELWEKDEWTWEKLEEMSKDWILQGETYYGVNFHLGSDVSVTRGLDLVTYDGTKYISNIEDAETLECWRFITNATQELWIAAGSTTYADTAKPTQLFGSIDATVLQGSSAYARVQKRLNAFGVVPLPAWETKEDYYVPLAEYLAYGVPQGAKNPKAVPYFLSYYLNFDNYDQETFFYDEHCKELYFELMDMPNRKIEMSSVVMVSEGGFDIKMLRRYVEPEQVNTWLQQQEYVIQAAIDTANDTLAQCEGQP